MLTRFRNPLYGSRTMSTSGSSIADEVELPEDLSGSVDIEHDVDASEDVAASRGDATSDQGEEVPRVVMNEVPRDDGPMRPDLIVGPPPEPTPVVEDEVSGEDRSEEEAYSDEFHEEDVVPEEVDETPVASVTAEEADPSEELPGTRDDTYGDDFEEYGDDDDVSAARSTPSPPARDPPTSPASQPLRSLGTPSPESSPPRDDDDEDEVPSPSPSPPPRDASGRTVDSIVTAHDAPIEDDYSWRLPSRSTVVLAAGDGKLAWETSSKDWRRKDPRGVTPKVLSSLMRRARAIADRRDQRIHALRRGESELPEERRARHGSGPVVVGPITAARLAAELTRLDAIKQAKDLRAERAAEHAAELARLTPEKRRSLYLAKAMQRVLGE